MKHSFRLLLAFILISISTFSQERKAKLSPLTKKYIYEITHQNKKKNIRNYVYKHGSDGGIYISGIIKINNAFNESDLISLGVKTGTKAGNILTVQIPVENVIPFTQLSGIDYIQLDEPTIPTLDAARQATHVDSVHAGINLPMPYNGDGVVVGIVDAGFDFGHITFFDTTGVNYRVKKVWLQKDLTGTAPAGYNYGTELTDSLSMWNKGTDDGQTHATHVGGIAAGSGYGSNPNNKRFRGVAYKSDLVFVGITPEKAEWINTGVSDMIDGINYVFQYAASISKPSVVNLSWGSPLGPHDGTGLFSQALDNLTGPGRIFVCSAGNNGEDKVHVQKTFSSSDTIVQTFLDIADSPEGKKTWVDVWGDSSENYCVKVSLFHNDSIISSTDFVCLDDSMHQFNLSGSHNDTLFLSVITSPSEFNNKPRVFIDFDSHVTDSVLISIRGNDGTVNMWNSFVSNTSGYYGSFNSFGKPFAVDGDVELTISDIASTKSAITVGAYASKVAWTNISGNSYTYTSYVSQGARVPFSSHGPTSDGRVKPDITGPGMTVGSSLSSYDTTFQSAGSDYLFVVSSYHDAVRNRDYPFGMLSGTSMSSPMVSGITALMLQVKNDLTPQDVKDIMAQTSIRDAFTGTIAAGGNYLWGNGKVNAYQAVKRVVQLQTGINNPEKSLIDCYLFPNPNEGTFILNYTSEKNSLFTVNIINVEGQNVFSDLWKINSGYNYKTIDQRNLAAGIYFVRISSGYGNTNIKMIVSEK